MPTPRRTVQRDIAAPGFRPVAYPVDTFTGPGLAGNKLSQLAEGLSVFAPSLERFAATKFQEEDKKTKEALDLKAQQDYERLLAEGRTFSEAVRDGLIENHQNPFYRNYYKNQIGKLMGYDAYAQWRVVRESDLSEATTLDEYDDRFGTFFDEFRQANFGDEAPTEGFNNVFLTALNQDRIAFASEAAARMQQFAFEHLQAEASNIARTMVESGASFDEVSTRLDATRQAFFAAEGAALTPEKRRLATMSLLRGYSSGLVALASDPDVPEGVAQSYLTEVLARITTGPGIKALDDPRLVELLESTRGSIARATNIATQELNRRNQAAVDDVVHRAIEAIVMGGKNTNLDEIILEANNLPPGARSMALPTLENLQQFAYNHARSLEIQTDDVWLQDIVGRAVNDPSKALLLQQELVTGPATGEDRMRVYNFLEGLQGRGADGAAVKAMMDHWMFKQHMTGIRYAIQQGDFNALDGDKAARLNNALLTYARAADAAARGNPSMDDLERMKVLQGIYDQTLNTFLTEADRETFRGAPPATVLYGSTAETMYTGRLFGDSPILYNALKSYSEAGGLPPTPLFLMLKDIGIRPREFRDVYLPNLDEILKAQAPFYPQLEPPR